MAFGAIKARQAWQMKPLLGYQINPSHHLSQGLVAAWILNEGGGTTTYDLSGNNYTGSLSGGASWAAGQFGPALSFDGSTGTFTSSTNLNLPGPVTLSVWFNAAVWVGFQQYWIGGCGINGGPYGGYWIRLNGGDIQFGVVASGGLAGADFSMTPILNQFVFACGVYNGSTIQSCVNGVGGTPVAQSGAINNTGNPFLLGVGPAAIGVPFQGLISQVLVHNRALTATEIWELQVNPFCFMQTPNIYLGVGTGTAPPAQTGFPLFFGSAA